MNKVLRAGGILARGFVVWYTIVYRCKGAFCMRNVDCVSFTVPELDAGIAQYTQGLRLREDVTGVVKDAE